MSGNYILFLLDPQYLALLLVAIYCGETLDLHTGSLDHQSALRIARRETAEDCVENESEEEECDDGDESKSTFGDDIEVSRVGKLYKTFTLTEVLNVDVIDTMWRPFFNHPLECCNQLIFRSLLAKATRWLSGSRSDQSRQWMMDCLEKTSQVVALPQIAPC